MAEILIVATADNHLSRYYARMTPSRLAERRARLRLGFGAAVEHAILHGAGLFLHGGDLFDSPDPLNADLGFVAEGLRRLGEAGVRVFAVGGNHDTPSGRSVQGGVAPLSPLADLHGLTYFGTPELERREFSVRGTRLVIGGLTPPPGQVAMDPLDALLGPEGEGVEIFLTHGAIEGHGFPGALEPVLRRETAAAPPDLGLVVCGHIHKRSVERAGDAVLLAPGATERLTWGELGNEPGFTSLLYDGGRVTDVRHHAVPPQPRASLALQVEALEEDEGDPYERARELVAASASPETMVRLVLSGGVERERYAALHLRELQEYGEAACFSFDLDASGLFLQEEWTPGAAARGVRTSQPEEIALVAGELIEAASTEEERELVEAARDALLEEYA